MFTILLFVLFGALAVGCALAMVAQRNPLYSAISLIGVFVIMLLNVEEEVRRPVRLHFLIPVGVLLAAVLIGEAAFILKLPGPASRIDAVVQRPSDVGLTASIGTGLFTEYLLPFEVTSVLILMALVGAITLARRTAVPRLAAPGNVDAAPPELGPRGQVVLQPGDTAGTGRAFARYQIEHGEAAAPAEEAGEGGER